MQLKDLKDKFLVRSWGYEQTNIDFWQIIDVKNKATLILQEVATKVVDSDGGRCDFVIPDKNNKIGEPFTKRIRVADLEKNQVFVKVSQYDYATLWDGNPKYQTNPHFAY